MFRLGYLLLLTLLVINNQALADPPAAATIVHLRGQVAVQATGMNTWQPASAGQVVEVGSTIRTGKDGWAALRLEDETLLHLNRYTVFKLSEVTRAAGWTKTSGTTAAPTSTLKSVYRLFSGEAWLRNKNRDVSIDVQAPNVTAAIRGTELHLIVAPDNTSTVMVLEGRIVASNSFGGLDVVPGEQVIGAPGKPLVKRIVLNPQDAVQWTLVVPPLYESRDAALAGAPVSSALEQAYQQLTSGEVQQARAGLVTLVESDPSNAVAWRLLALTALTLNDKEQALAAAEKAVVVAPESTAALVVLGYTYQAMFDLERAEQAIRKALTIEPGNVLALTNLARIQFGSDLVDAAEKTIAGAAQLAPGEAEVHNLRGFILLARRKVDAAIAAFEQALILSPGLGEPYLGLGIAHMRQGDTDQAIESITTAVLLEPRRSLFMSYWAKMLYQVERFDRALEVLATAQEFDPRDPTPELYRAMILRDLNRPAEAIDSLNQAMALNDNRAVYRSRFLLDQDLAVANVDLSQVYLQLGLNRWARKKAIDSIKLDYTNHAGHRFLAGAMEGDSNRSWSYLSESKLGDLLMPANLNSFNSYNQYTSLFEKPALNGTATLTGGTQGFTNFETFAYGAAPSHNLAYIGSVQAGKTDGWRETNGGDIRGLAVNVNWDPTPNDGLLLSGSLGKQRLDDRLDRRYEYDAPARPDDGWEGDSYRLEAGYHHRFSPGRDVLVYLARTDRDEHLVVEDYFSFDVPGLEGRISDEIKGERPYYQAQAHLLWETGNHQLMGGLLWYDMDNNYHSTATFEILYNGELIGLDEVSYGSNQVKRFASAYAADYWRFAEDWVLEGALYFEHMENSSAILDTDWTLDEVNPRLGLIWHPADRHTLRLAAFRYLLPSLSARLDPTDVAGVTMARNNVDGALAEEADLVWEYEWGSGLVSVNPFYTQREFKEKTPLEDGTEVMLTYDGEASGVEFSWNQLLWQGTGLAADYRYLDTWDERQPISDRSEHAFRLTLTYVHPSGFSALLSQTLRDINSDDPDRPDELIPVTDLGFTWELPKKSGALSVAVLNLFDEKFNWVTDQFVTRGRDPTRQVFVGMSVNF